MSINPSNYSSPSNFSAGSQWTSFNIPAMSQNVRAPVTCVNKAVQGATATIPVQNMKGAQLLFDLSGVTGTSAGFALPSSTQILNAFGGVSNDNSSSLTNGTRNINVSLRTGDVLNYVAIRAVNNSANTNVTIYPPVTGGTGGTRDLGTGANGLILLGLRVEDDGSVSGSPMFRLL